MAINKKLIHFKSKENFEKEVANENILDTSICFIQDSKEISTHGTIYKSVNWSILESDPFNGHAYVDLGLPSGTLWADRNVGADTPEAYGDYFAWGETESKNYYNWSNYKWCKGSEATLTKYCTNSSYGTIDGKTILDLEDDAAHVHMGGNWRMPTMAEQEELLNNCTWTWITQNGVNGYKVTGPNGNSIFLPAAGYHFDGFFSRAGSNGYYWSSSLREGNSSIACYLSFKSGNCEQGNNYRYFGRSVRGIITKNI